MKKRYLIALGASAGGLSALCEFFDNTLPDGFSYVVTTHLYPQQKSLLAELLQKHSCLEVCEAEHAMPVRANVVYVMPENKVMTIERGQLMLTPRDLSVKINMAIDIFFESLAKDNHFGKIAIILSGMGMDGTEGIKALAENGGYIIAQAPVSAEWTSMPDSVIASGYVSQILAPENMPQAIADYVNR